MNYLFYLGIIIPTAITIVLFLVFIYCWFLQKARKEVLTKRYDPHGKMRRLGLSMEPPSPPAYCRMGSIDLVSDSGEDNEAYDVSRSPSTEQNVRGRPMYRTYHDSGISAGLSAGLSPTQEFEPRPRLSYRSCPDSGISGFGVQTMQTSASIHQHVCRGCCSSEDIHLQQIQPHQPQQQQPLEIQQLILLQQQQQTNLQFQQIHPQEPFQNQTQHHNVMFHHNNTVPASVHPNHGVCYGDNMTHPQSPQHYNPPPFQALVPQSLAINNVDGPISVQQPSTVNFLPNIQEHPPSAISRTIKPCSSSQTSLQISNLSPTHPLSPSHHIHTSSCCQFQPQQPLSPQHSYNQQHQFKKIPNQSQISPQQYNTSPKSPDYINGDGGVSALATSSFKPKPFTVHSRETRTKNLNKNISSHIVPATPQSHSSSFQSSMHSHRDSGVLEVSHNSLPNSSPSDRPDSQASASSTTDSEDSGFRSSHCAAQQRQQPNPSLNKNVNPLLKPLRRPKTHAKSKLKSGNVDTHRTQQAKKLATLNPQNLPAEHNDLNNTQTSSVLELGEINHITNNNRQPPRLLSLTGQTDNELLAQHSPTHDKDWTVLNSQNEAHLNSKHSKQPQQQQQQQTFDMTDISTHLSWKYLQDMSAASLKSTCSEGSTSSADDTHRVVSPLLRHTTSEPSSEVLGFSVV